MSRYEGRAKRFGLRVSGLELEPETRNPKLETNNLSIDMLIDFNWVRIRCIQRKIDGFFDMPRNLGLDLI
jgi:hypothetical protein